MSKKSNSQPQQNQAGSPGTRITEDWLAVILAFSLSLLAVIGLIGPNLINITF